MKHCELNIKAKPKDTSSLLPTDILFQTSYWGRVKSELGWQAHAFDLSTYGPVGDVLILTRFFGNGKQAAYVPQGPEHSPDRDDYGIFLEELSNVIAAHLGSEISFVRYDLPWKSQYAPEHTVDRNETFWSGHPEDRLRELRMNIGTRTWNLRKAPYDLTVADTLIVSIDKNEESILSRMKPKTRYNIRLAQRKGVTIVQASSDGLPVFYDLYCQTAERNGFPSCSYRHFVALFSTLDDRTEVSPLNLLLAVHEGEVLAGAIVAISGGNASYLFGASSNRKRNLMAPYAIQWEAIRIAKASGCRNYEMGAVSPSNDADHHFHGMYRFKSGFGGRILHRNGSWDYFFDSEGYKWFRTRETVNRLVEL
jgi:lipid II:glycine glycyltransferase (peptidoglycan interpeptide bridge formation enzyme)